MSLDVARAGDEFERLRVRLEGHSDPETRQLVEALRTNLEELRVAEEELTRQNEELAGLHLALAEEVTRYRTLFELAPMAHFTTNAYGVVGDANESAAALLGMDRRFLVGKPLFVYVDEAQRRELRSAMRDLFRDGGVIRRSVRMHRRGGVAFDAVIVARAVAEGIQWAVDDVSEERQSERRLWELNRELEARVVEQAGELATVLERLPIGVVIVEPETLVIRRANARAQAILGDGVAPGTEIGLAGFERADARGSAVGRDGWAVTRALAGQTVDQEVVTLTLGDGRRVSLEVNAVPARADDGRITAAVITLDDVTVRDARERAEREFVTNAAHELRTPLTAIATAVEVLQSGAKEIPEERDLFLSHLERECGRLARLGSALLSLARAQARAEAPQLSVVSLHDVLGNIAAELAVADDVELRVECPPEVGALSNRDLLDQAVWNLATNAARYTAHGEIVLAARLDGESAVVEIRDTGRGISDDVRPRLFERFFRAGDESGFGLGLSIAKQSVEAVGGTLSVESTDGNGTLARISLPSARLL
jgi:two-component system phosphate regulon sensor histidine kinase PhoR